MDIHNRLPYHLCLNSLFITLDKVLKKSSYLQTVSYSYSYSYYYSCSNSYFYSYSYSYQVPENQIKKISGLKFHSGWLGVSNNQISLLFGILGNKISLRFKDPNNQISV